LLEGLQEKGLSIEYNATLPDGSAVEDENWPLVISKNKEEKKILAITIILTVTKKN
jgi:hypothetical protein